MNRLETLWQAANPEELDWEEFDGEFFVFNPRSGQTHVLNALAAAVLRDLQTSPRGVASLAEAFAEADPRLDRQSLQQALPSHLAQLDELGLIVSLES